MSQIAAENVEISFAVTEPSVFHQHGNEAAQAHFKAAGYKSN